ncbi:mitochondrial 54S ribosomal protein YmL23 [Talaromyces proteolyticus]|uniref:Large ribosomal subunit protein uL13m n=1 Tax=Talaromyces proteolyticus TaxID=1131652 RepID=A0AAD4KIM2_9EURO|nr:mitochondrial 54S ribosomal protein YmL23 [Talaromyces proteolyticus]KAH8691218.1 mitochondrial 54S ribosomal protein YmL23 [Talaromyces proteolyticus]
MSQTIGRTRLAYSRTWHHIDVGADDRSLGRLASSIAVFLMGKHKPIYDPSTDCGDYVVAVGCRDLYTTGKKRFQKKYYTHTTRPGSLKSMTMDKMFEKWGGGEVLRRAVRGMLPKNRLRDKRMDRLKTFEGLAHPYKKNIVKINGKSVLSSLPEVTAAFKAEKDAAESSTSTVN